MLTITICPPSTAPSDYSSDYTNTVSDSLIGCPKINITVIEIEGEVSEVSKVFIPTILCVLV